MSLMSQLMKFPEVRAPNHRSSSPLLLYGCRSSEELGSWSATTRLMPQLTKLLAETTAISVSGVLDNGDLLREILLRLRFSICLGRAALVHKSWLLIIADQDFLSTFHSLHPPALLGFYLVAERRMHPLFVGLEDPPPELSLLIRRASTYFDTWVDVPVTIWDCRNGQLLIDIFDRLAVQSPLHPSHGIAVYPHSPLKVVLDRSFKYNVLEFLPQNGGKRGEYYRLAIGFKDDSILAYLFLLHKGIWEVHTSELTKLSASLEASEFLVPYGVLIHQSMYLMTNANAILVLNVQSLNLNLVDLTDEIEVASCDDFDIGEAESHQEFHLLCLHRNVLRIWVHDMETSAWQLVQSINLHEVFQRSGTLGSDVAVDSMDCDFGLFGALDSELIFIGANEYVCLLNVKDKTAQKMYQISEEHGDPIRLCPCKKIWPPTFPLELIRHVEQERVLLLEELGTDGQLCRPQDIHSFSPLVPFEGIEITRKENEQGSGRIAAIVWDQQLRQEQLSHSMENDIPIDLLIHHSCIPNFVNGVRGKCVEESHYDSKVQFLLDRQEPES